MVKPREATLVQANGSSRPRVVAVVQARLSSSRLPRKVLADVSGEPMIVRMLSQLSGLKTVDEVVVATSDHHSDDELADALQRRGARVLRGPLEDVLGRFVATAEAFAADVIVRLTGDCPLHTADTVDEVVSAFLASGADYASNSDAYTRPDGLDVEVFTRAALDLADRTADPGPDREHVTPRLRRSNEVKRLAHRHTDGLGGARLRWTVDEPEDLEYVRRVWARLDRLGPAPHSYATMLTAAREEGSAETTSVSNEGYYASLFRAASGSRAAPLPLARSEELLRRSVAVVPGGAQTYSKSWRQHIRGVSPVFLECGEGAWVTDVDGTRYVDMIQGLLPNILGYAHPEVDRAVYERCRRGNSFSMAHPLEVELAERLTRIIPCAEQVRFGKNGSDATAGAVRIARAHTGRDRVATCGYHGWQDWFIGTTTRNAGVPEAVARLASPFPYNDLEALDRVLSAHPGEFAAVIMEPFNFFWPAEGYLEGVRELAHRHGALLVFDEICTGWHLGLGGAQKRFGVTPDLAAFGKAMGNGYPISCVVGRRDVMRTFEDAFVSFTFAGDVGAIAAAMAVVDVLEHTDALDRIESAGRRLADGALVFAREAGLGNRFRVDGHPAWSLIRFLNEEGGDDPLLKTLWSQEVTRRGVLVLATHNMTAAHDLKAQAHVLGAYAEAFAFVGALVRRGEPLAEYLDGPVPSPAFRARG